MTEGIKQAVRKRMSEYIDDVFYLTQCMAGSESGDIPPDLSRELDTYIDRIVDIAIKVAEKNKTPPKPIFWARKCDATGCGMNDGYVFGDGEKYFALESDALRYAQSLGYKDLDDAYSDRAFYWTEWEEDRDYLEIDGKLIEIH